MKRAHLRSFYILFKVKPSLCSESRVSLCGSVSLCERYARIHGLNLPWCSYNSDFFSPVMWVLSTCICNRRDRLGYLCDGDLCWQKYVRLNLQSRDAKKGILISQTHFCLVSRSKRLFLVIISAYWHGHLGFLTRSSLIVEAKRCVYNMLIISCL